MAFTDIGLAKGLSVVPDYNAMIAQEDKRFGMQNEVMQQVKSDAEKEAKKMELGTVYDQYNRDRYNSFVEKVHGELYDFDNTNENWGFSPKLIAQRNNIIAKYKDNDIIRESSQTKAEQDKLYDYIAKNPGAENNPNIKKQIEQLSKTLTGGNIENNISKGYRFAAPQSRDLRTEVMSLLPFATSKDVKHEKGMLFTRTRLNEDALGKQVESWFLNPQNAAFAQTTFAGLDDFTKQMYQGNPMNMIKIMSKEMFTPEDSNPTQYHNYGSGSGSRTKPKEAEPGQYYNAYNAQITNGGGLTNNPSLKAAIVSIIDKDGNQIVDNRINGNTVIGYKGTDGKNHAMSTPKIVTVVSGKDMINIPVKNGQPLTMVKGEAKWVDSYDDETNHDRKLELIRQKYIDLGIPVIIKPQILTDGSKNGLFDVTMPNALFTGSTNEKEYNRRNRLLNQDELPKGVQDWPAAVPTGSIPFDMPGFKPDVWIYENRFYTAAGLMPLEQVQEYLDIKTP